MTPDGRRFSGGDAVAPIARLLPGGAPVAVLAGALARPTRAGYGWVAANRTRISRLVPARAKDAATGAIERHRARVLAQRQR